MMTDKSGAQRETVRLTLQEARDAGIVVTGIEIDPDGTVKGLVDKPELADKLTSAGQANG